MTKKQKILEIAESIKLPDGWKIKLNLEIIKYNRECPIDTTRIWLDDNSDKMYAEMTRSGCIYKDTLQDKSEKWMLKAEEVLRKIEETKLSKKMVLQKRDDLNNNQLKTNQGENIL